MGLLSVENIAEIFLNGGKRHLVAVAGDDGFVEEVEAPKFVDPVNMVGVMMGIQYPVYLPDVVP